MEERVIVRRPPKSPFLAGLLSFIFPSAGTFYNSEYVKGIIYLLIFAGLVTLQGHGESQPFMGLILGGFYFFQLIDSINVAKAINRKAMLGENGEPAPSLTIPEVAKTGSVFWGVVLMALGAIFLLANFDIIDYGRIFDFWPLVIILIGVKFIVDYFSKKK